MGIYDRDYIRERSSTTAGPAGSTRHGGGHPVTWTLIAINGILFLAYVSLPPVGQHFVLEHFTLSRDGVFGNLYLHTLLTPGFFHATFGHFVVNMVLLWCLASTLEEEATVGSRNLWWLYLLGALAGSLMFLTLPVEARALGASGAVLALAIVAALAVPHRSVSLFGLVSVPMVGFVVLVVVLSLIPMGTVHGDGVAHLAHLGGLAAGVLYYIFDLRLFTADGRLRLRRRHRSHASAPTASTGEADADAATKSRMERLLAKISQTGIESLTEEERKFLNEASRKYR